MKKSKYLIIILAFLTCFSFILVGCGGNNDNENTLDTPQITFSNGTITWQQVKNAEKYEYFLNGNIYYTYENIIDLNLTYSEKTFEIKVKAISGNHKFSNSTFSDTLKFTSFYIPHILDIHSLSINEATNEIKFLISTDDALFSPHLPKGVEFIKVFINNNIIIKIYPNDINYERPGSTYYYSLNIPISKFTAKTNTIKVQFCNSSEYVIDSKYSNTLIVNL